MKQLLSVAAFAVTCLGPAALAEDAAPFLLGPICRADASPPIVGPHKLVMLPGMGDDHLAADTANPEAQRWFDYGLSLARSFEHADAILAFQKSESLDPDCSLCVWGEAWSRGPTINYPVGRAETEAALALALKAQTVAKSGARTQIKALEAALVDRYHTSNRDDSGDRLYARDLDALNAADPQDVELAVFDAEASLILENDGDASRVIHALEVLKPLVPRHPDHTGLVHFFIHASEEAKQPELAQPYVERMAALASSASHMVHMPAHTYFRIGRYHEAALANLKALVVDRRYAEKTDFPTPLGHLMYHFHDIQFGLAAALMSGDAELAQAFITQFNRDFPDPQTYDPRAQMAAGQVYAALGRLAPPAEVLAAPDTVKTLPFLEAMRHYARGEAFLRQGDAGAARSEAALVAPTSDTTLSNTVRKVAALSLTGQAAMLDHQYKEAAASFREAAALQDGRLAAIVDPPRWWRPEHRDLAAALLASGDVAGTESELRVSLAVWKADPVALALLAQAQGAVTPGAGAQQAAQARHLWRGKEDVGAVARSAG